MFLLFFFFLWMLCRNAVAMDLQTNPTLSHFMACHAWSKGYIFYFMHVYFVCDQRYPAYVYDWVCEMEHFNWHETFEMVLRFITKVRTSAFTCLDITWCHDMYNLYVDTCFSMWIQRQPWKGIRIRRLRICEVVLVLRSRSAFFWLVVIILDWCHQQIHLLLSILSYHS